MSFTKKINVNDGSGRKFEEQTTAELPLDVKPEVGSFNAITSDAVARAVAGASGEVPEVTENDDGKVLKAVYDEGGPAVEWGDAPNELPEYSAADEGKVLGVVTEGVEDTPALGWVEQQTATAGDGIDITDGTVSVNTAQNGGLDFDSGALKVANPVPDTAGVPNSAVLAMGNSGMEWVEGGVPSYMNITTGTVSIARDNTVVTSTADMTSIIVGANVKSAVVQWVVNSTTTLPTVTDGTNALKAAVNNPASLTVGRTVQVSILNGTWVCAEFA